MTKEKVILTGDRPTGRLHIGHYVGSLRRRVELQNEGDFKKMFVFIADAQALTDNIDNPEKVRQNVIEVALDYLACGLDPEKVTLFIQSQIPELCELSFYFMDLVSVSRLQRNAACLRLPGTDGKAKMSKSLGNCIYLSETADEVQKKVMSMYTDPEHIHVADPGHIEGNTVFTYLDAFCRPEHFERYWNEYANLDEVKAHYQRGGLGDMKVKRFLNNILQEELEPIRARRKEYEKDIPAIYDMLKKGCEEAREVAAQTLADVRRAMKIDYFNDAALIQEQAKRFSE